MIKQRQALLMKNRKSSQGAARRREEKFEDVPVSVTEIGADQLSRTAS